MSLWDDFKDGLDGVGDRLGEWTDRALDGVEEQFFGGDKGSSDTKAGTERVIDQTAANTQPVTAAPATQSGFNPLWLAGGAAALLAVLVIAKKV